MNSLLENFRLYLIAFLLPLGLSLALTPFLRRVALAFGHMDKPTDIKTHTVPTPLFGGVAVALVQPWVAGRVGWPEGIEVVAVTEALEARQALQDRPQ